MIRLKSIVDKLYNLEDLSYQESYQLFDYIIKGQIQLPLQNSIYIEIKLKK
ncbi:anthranilate phosphoribosyltransferase, partial [Francisella tularensis subsp. holarctica]|nr:anthranilate phosphoribosyltransferase [Francisella tularensis subsp. holarctica]